MVPVIAARGERPRHGIRLHQDSTAAAAPIPDGIDALGMATDLLSAVFGHAGPDVLVPDQGRVVVCSADPDAEHPFAFGGPIPEAPAVAAAPAAADQDVRDVAELVGDGAAEALVVVEDLWRELDRRVAACFGLAPGARQARRLCQSLVPHDLDSARRGSH